MNKPENMAAIWGWAEKRGCKRFIIERPGTVSFVLPNRPRADFYPNVDKWRLGSVTFRGDADQFLTWYEGKMDNTEAIKILEDYLESRKCGNGDTGWPLDSDYGQHIKFVQYRNEHLVGDKEYKDMIGDYIGILKKEK